MQGWRFSWLGGIEGEEGRGVGEMGVYKTLRDSRDACTSAMTPFILNSPDDDEDEEEVMWISCRLVAVRDIWIRSASVRPRWLVSPTSFSRVRRWKSTDIGEEFRW